MTKTKTKLTAAQIAERTKDAYSFKAYASWADCAQVCLNRGYTAEETEEILRSKITRWADDARPAHKGKATGDDLARFLDDPRNKCRETFMSGIVRVAPVAPVAPDLAALALKSLTGLLAAVERGDVSPRHVNREAVLLSLVRVLEAQVDDDMRQWVARVLGCVWLT